MPTGSRQCEPETQVPPNTERNSPQRNETGEQILRLEQAGHIPIFAYLADVASEATCLPETFSGARRRTSREFDT
jgi:hypothetical protein